MTTIPSLNDPRVFSAMSAARAAFQSHATKSIAVNNKPVTVPYPYPSPTDWRETWIYFLMTDRFNNATAAPNSVNANPSSAWNQRYNYRQGGTFKGIEAQLDYILGLGARAIWITPVLKNPKPDSAPDWPYNYHGYATQDFLTIDGRFASDGTESTAVTELTELIEAAHARGLYVVLDIVINHSAEVFDYLYQGQVARSFSDAAILYGPLGDEPPIRWVDGSGQPQAGWQDSLPAPGQLTGDDAVWPTDLQAHEDFFRRRGALLSNAAPPGGFAKGDFGTMRQLVAEYLAVTPNQASIRNQYGQTPVANILVQIYTYLIATFDIDAFRIDTVKYVAPEMVQTFCNAIREFALSIGKRNFFTFGEIYDDEATIAQFVGVDSIDNNGNGFGLDAALDFPLFYKLPNVAKGFGDVAAIRQVFEQRKTAEENLISSHGEAGQYFVSFLDNHDQDQRFNYPGMPAAQVLLGAAVLFGLQGIPCLYYGTEQGLDGTKDAAGNPDTVAPESVREALWGKTPLAFDTGQSFYTQLAKIGHLRTTETALQYGRLYFREVSGNGQDFGQSGGFGGIISFSRILYDREVLIVANTSTNTIFSGFVLMDIDINRSKLAMSVSYSNLGTTGTGNVQIITAANFYSGSTLTGTADTAALYVSLAPMEVQVLTPAPLIP
jgi:glycosidase